jgi:adenylate cyclase
VSEEGVERKLTAILAADVVGYSRLMGEDEAGTLARLKSLRKDLVQPKITGGHGRIVKLMGDGLLAEFPSVVEAVRCAVDIQQDMIGREPDLPDEQRIRLRIGVNLGDIIVEGSDIYGDGVNIAARLEALADPGGICISGKVYEEVKNKLPTAFEDLGEQEVKNIREPVRVHRWTDTVADPVPGMAGAEGALPLSDKPSIAVLPFTNLSGDPEQGYFADGISEDITTDLSKVSGLFVIARNSSFAYKGQNPDVRKVSHELGVRYVLEGSVRKASGRVRINAQMIDGSTGGHIWAERYDRKVEDIFAVQDEVTHAIIDALKVELGDKEQARREGRGKVNPEAYDCLLRARQCLDQMSAKSLNDSRIMLMRAIELDPGLAAAYATLSIIYCTEYLNKWNDPSPNHLEQALEFARQACERDKNEPRAYYALAHCQMWLMNWDDAERAAQRALELDPNFAGGFAALGLVRDYTGRHEDAVSLFERALKLHPQYGMALQYLGRAQFALGRYDEAERTFTRRLIHSPRSDMTRAFLASLYGHTGRAQDAHRLWQEVMELNSDFSVEHIRRVLPFRDPLWFDRFVDGLSKVGLPE